MIKPLRQRHLQIWTALAVLLPAGIIMSWLVIPNPVPVKILNPATADLLPIIKHKKDTEQYCINIRTNKENTAWQLEWKNKLALVVPSAVIYKASLNPSEGATSASLNVKHAELIGRIETKGDYIFKLQHDFSRHERLQLILYDFIHQKVIETLNIKIPR
jgi:hypothetical protein